MNPLTGACPWVESPFFEQFLESRGLSPEHQELARRFHDDGFLVLDDVVSEEEGEQLKASVAPLYTDEAEGPRSRYRVQDAWRDGIEPVRALAGHARVLEVLRALYDRRPIPFQTLNFRHGTQQPAHADTLHFTCLPRGFMCGVWVALEDMTPDNGPLLYYPGSHRLPDIDYLGVDPSQFEAYQDEYLTLLERRFERREFCARRGQALVWAANLWHGGTPIKKAGATRHSQVTHYYFEDCFYFAPQNSHATLGRFRLKDIVDVTTGEPVPQRYNGIALEPTPAPGGDWSFLSPAP